MLLKKIGFPGLKPVSLSDLEVFISLCLKTYKTQTRYIHFKFGGRRSNSLERSLYFTSILLKLYPNETNFLK